MQTLTRIGTIAQYPLIAWLVLMLIVAGFDLPSAWNAQSCGTPGAGPNCYPWTTEGPSGDFWNYASKRLYLASGMFDALVAAAALATWPLFAKDRRFIVILIAILLIYTTRFWLPSIV